MNKLYDNLSRIKSTVPPNEIGNWAIEKFEVSEEGASFHNLRCALHGSHREIETGTYTKLTRQSTFKDVVMSDTPAEIRDHLNFMYRAEGDVLVNGLGLGLVIEGLMSNPNVKHVTVIEISSDVIQLVAGYLKSRYDGQLSIIHADALEWKSPKGKVYNCVWHDIWPNICGDYYDDMKRLHRKYARKTKYQNSWCREEIKQAAGIS